MLGITQPGTLPAPELMGLLAEWSFIPVFLVLGFMLLLFPSGTLPSPRWRLFAGLALLATALAMTGSCFSTDDSDSDSSCGDR